MAVYPRLAVGVVLMAVVCLTAWRLGDRPVRLAALVIAVAWTVGTAGQIVFRRQAEPILVGDVVAAAGLLRLAWSYHRRWLWIAICIQAAIFFVHAAYYPPPAVLPVAERWANNALNTAGLGVILAAAMMSWRDRRLVRHGAENL